MTAKSALRWRRAGLALALLLSSAADQAWAAAEGSMVILTVDADYLQSTMPIYTRIAAAADQAAIGASTQRKSDIELARELRQSEVLTALPEAIAEVARSANADLVLDRAVAKRIGEAASHDITAEVERILVAQFANLPLEPGS